jgi:hypothetical protein
MDRLSLADCRKLLGAEADSLGDEQMARVREELYAVSDVLVDIRTDFIEQAKSLGGEALCPVDLLLNAFRAQLPDDDDEFVDDDTYHYWDGNA